MHSKTLEARDYRLSGQATLTHPRAVRTISCSSSVTPCRTRLCHQANTALTHPRTLDNPVQVLAGLVEVRFPRRRWIDEGWNGRFSTRMERFRRRPIIRLAQRRSSSLAQQQFLEAPRVCRVEQDVHHGPERY